MTAPSPLEKLAEEIDAHCRENGRDWHVTLTAGANCYWACELIVVLTPDRDDGPDRGLTAYAAAGEGPEDVLRRAWADMLAWLGKLADQARARGEARARLAARAKETA